MDKQKKYLITLYALMMGTIISLSYLGESRLDVYLSLFTVSYFASTALYQPRKRGFDILGAALFLLFTITVAIKIWEIIT